jgi:hypothetical protein
VQLPPPHPPHPSPPPHPTSQMKSCTRLLCCLCPSALYKLQLNIT